jgi:hypothetical protein
MPTEAEKYALFDACEEMYAEKDDGISQFAVISAVNNLIYGPFHTYATADRFAEEVDGSIFKLVEVDHG